jgi:large subunit ribosomal protein L10
MGLNLERQESRSGRGCRQQVANAQTIALSPNTVALKWVHLTKLRKKARESGVYLRVLKNTLVRRAVADTPFAGLAEQMVGPLIYSDFRRCRWLLPRC